MSEVQQLDTELQLVMQDMKQVTGDDTQLPDLMAAVLVHGRQPLKAHQVVFPCWATHSQCQLARVA